MREFSETHWLIECTSQRCRTAPDRAFLIPIEQITEAALDDPRTAKFTLIPLQPRLPAVP